jgi:beta-mannan synthase
LPQPQSGFILRVFFRLCIPPITTTPNTMKSLFFEEPEGEIPGYASSGLRYAWQSIRAPVIIPLLKLAVILCSIMSVMLFLERVGMAAVILIVKVLRKKKYTKYKLDAMKQNIERNKRYPMVLIQIPMYNEKEVRLLCN